MERRSLLKLLSLATAGRLSVATGIAHASSQAAAGPAVPFPNEARGESTSIFLNQVGYLPEQGKIATIVGVPPEFHSFTVRSVKDSGIAFRGTISEEKQDSASGDRVRLADFSSLAAPGQYYLEVAGQRSDPFSVSREVYAGALRSAMRAFYGQRCGCSVDLGSGYAHPACHMSGEFHASSGKSGPVSNAGGWHDAGDYGRYVVNSGITCGTLLWAWEMFPSSLRGLDLGIPRTHPHLPDFLLEVLWNLDWMLSLQDEDGGVFHKQTSERFCAFIMPQDDTLPSEIIGTGSAPYKSTGATADLAAVMAIAARCYAPFDSKLAARFLSSARRAWTWASAHPNVVFRNPQGISTGEYGDRDLGDELLWAAAELWRTTGEKTYESAFLSAAAGPVGDLKIVAPSWGSVAPLAYWSYVLAEREKREDVASAIRDATHGAATQLARRCRENGYGNTLALSDYNWGSNGGAANQSVLLAVAHRMRPDPAMAGAALENLHYLLGRNCHGVSWVTQVGSRPFQHPHHRPSAADKVSAPWPGLLSGGPNAHPGDPVAKGLANLPPMRMWVDDQGAYSMNEVAINWNAPLVFLLAFANALPATSS